MFGLNAKQAPGLALLLLALFAAWQVVPAYFHAFQFNDFVRQEVRFAASGRRTGENIRARIVEKAPEFGLAVKPGDIRMARRGPALTVELDYAIPVDLRWYRRDLHFHLSAAGELFDQ